MPEIFERSNRDLLPPAPVVSVYMATYNHGPFLADAIEGVMRQAARFPIELVIAEDCSTDDTREIAETYQQRRPDLIRLVTGPANVGARPNFKRTFPLLRGEFIAYCEGDDYWTDPEKLQRQMDVFHSNPRCSLVFHAARIVDAGTGIPLGKSRWSRRSRRFLTEDLVLGDGGMVATASILARRSVLANQRPWALDAPIGDYPLVLSAALAGDVVYLDRCMSVYRSNVPQSWTQRHIPTLENRMRYARSIETMLGGFAAEASGPARSAVATVISKYYSDAIVRSSGGSTERRLAYEEAVSRLLGSDRWLAWLAARHGVRLVRTKDRLRQMKTLHRLARSEWRHDLAVADGR